MVERKNLYCILMAGGIGSRFWPLSRTSRPKQFIDILGTGKSLLQQTFDRMEKIAQKMVDEYFTFHYKLNVKRVSKTRRKK